MTKQIVEIEGVKIEVDLREAKQIQTYKVGDPVKVLIKNYSGYKVHAGIIAGFDEFKKLPTLIVAYLDSSDLKFVYLNAQSEDTEICPANAETLNLEKQEVLDAMDREIIRKEDEVKNLRAKQQFFLNRFGRHFNE